MSLKGNPERQRLSNGKYVEWKDVKVVKLLDSLEFDVGKKVPDDRKTLVWYHMFDNGLEKYRRLPKWEKPKNKHMTSGTGAQWREYYKSLGSPAELDLSETVEADHLPGYELFNVPLKERSTTFQAAAKENNTSSASASAPATAQTTHALEPVSTSVSASTHEIPLLYGINDTIDITPSSPPERFGFRDYETNEDMMNSCVYPGKKPTPEEEAREVREAVGCQVDRSCDQIRACISRLVRYSTDQDVGGKWSLDAFRQALGGINERSRLEGFLERRGAKGPSAGARSVVFQLAWEFFKKRDVLGIPLPSAETMQSSGEKTGGKRKRAVLAEKAGNALPKSGEDAGGKRAKTGNGSVEAPLVI